jgi:hypothetical protein
VGLCCRHSIKCGRAAAATTAWLSATKRRYAERAEQVRNAVSEGGATVRHQGPQLEPSVNRPLIPPPRVRALLRNSAPVTSVGVRSGGKGAEYAHDDLSLHPLSKENAMSATSLYRIVMVLLLGLGVRATPVQAEARQESSCVLCIAASQCPGDLSVYNSQCQGFCGLPLAGTCEYPDPWEGPCPANRLVINCLADQ